MSAGYPNHDRALSVQQRDNPTEVMHIGAVGNRMVGNYQIPRAGQPVNSASGSDPLIGLRRHHTKR